MEREELIQLIYLLKKWIPENWREATTTANNEIEQINKVLTQLESR